MPPPFPVLPILSPQEVRRSEREKYGVFFYLGIAGLVVLVALISWFAWGVWSLRAVWTHVYTMNDSSQPEAARIQAAQALAADPRVSQRQLWDLALSRVPPAPARYIVAEALTGDAIAADPNGFALAVARSEGWPAWLRMLLVRPLAYGADQHALPKEPLQELRDHADPVIGLWAAYAQAVSRDNTEAARFLSEQASREGESLATLAQHLRDAYEATARSAERKRHLDAATAWIRLHHPAAAALWKAPHEPAAPPDHAP